MNIFFGDANPFLNKLLTKVQKYKSTKPVFFKLLNKFMRNRIVALSIVKVLVFVLHDTDE